MNCFTLWLLFLHHILNFNWELNQTVTENNTHLQEVLQCKPSLINVAKENKYLSLNLF